MRVHGTNGNIVTWQWYQDNNTTNSALYEMNLKKINSSYMQNSTALFFNHCNT